MSHHLMAEHISDKMQECIENCSNCHDVCVKDHENSPGVIKGIPHL
jgi:hypothetical protein